eukprot:15462993-Alexandrium_andersonii.AAC.1
MRAEPDGDGEAHARPDTRADNKSSDPNFRDDLDWSSPIAGDLLSTGRPLMCGTKCGAALHPAGSVLEQFLACPPTGARRRRFFLGGPGGREPSP